MSPKEKPQDNPKVIEAERFIVRDQNGTERASLGIRDTEDELVFTLCDRKGVPKICLQMIDDYPTMGFMTREGYPLFSFAKSENGAPIVGIGRENGIPALLITANKEGDVQIDLFRNNGEHACLDIEKIFAAQRRSEEEK